MNIEPASKTDRFTHYSNVKVKQQTLLQTVVEYLKTEYIKFDKFIIRVFAVINIYTTLFITSTSIKSPHCISDI